MNPTASSAGLLCLQFGCPSSGYLRFLQIVQEFVTLWPDAGYDYLSSGGVSREMKAVLYRAPRMPFLLSSTNC